MIVSRITAEHAKIEKMKEATNLMEAVLDRIDPTFGKTIDCEEGWYDLILTMNSEIEKIDPDYRIYQVKEKFGSLRVYFQTSGPQFEKKIWDIIKRYERASQLTCEKTGKPGLLMKKDGHFKTLHPSFMNEGWEPVEAN